MDRARALLNALCAMDRRLAGVSDAILGVDTRRVSEVGDTSYILHKQGKNCLWFVENDAPVWCERDLDVMEARVKAARSLFTPQSDVNAPPDFSPTEQVSLSQKKSLPSGWRLLSEQEGWRPCPIGIYV